MKFEKLYKKAQAVIEPQQLSEHAEAGGVGAALLTVSGNIYTGTCLDTECSLGFCAEKAAVAGMVTAGESKILKIIAVDWDGSVMPPCGTCRELISQLHPQNMQAEVEVEENKIMTVEELLPRDWK